MTEATVAVSPLRRRMIDDMSLRGPVASDPAILFARGHEVQPLLRAITGLPRA